MRLSEKTKMWFPPAAAIVGMLVVLSCLAAYTMPQRIVGETDEASASEPASPPKETTLGLNLFGLATFTRQQVFTNLITQSEWFVSRGQGWTPMPPERIDERGWVRFLQPGETAPRPLILPPAPFHSRNVRCVYQGKGKIDAGGIARLNSQGDQWITLILQPTGAADEGAWIELIATDPRDPVRAIDCREAGRPPTERFHPEFVAFLRGFKAVRFLDWQRTNDNADAVWSMRSLPSNASQAGVGGASIEDMVDLANQAGVDPWFLMPYQADAAYIRRFAKLVHDRLAPERTVYVELGNEIWNDMFDASQQAQREGLALRLGDGDPTRAQMFRYAQKVREAMRIWSEVFADNPDRLVRIAAAQNANPDLAEMILGYEDTATWVDALATAPYIWVEMDGYHAKDVDRIFARVPKAIDDTIGQALQNQRIANRYNKRFIAYEGGQHLVTPDLALANAVQRDPRMNDAYRRYLDAWQKRVGGVMMLYASTAPIGEYGSWGLREYAGQPLEQAPKLKAVRQFLSERQ